MAELILIGGGSCSGKTTVATALKERLGASAVLLSMDSFYKGITSGDKVGPGGYNFDHPEAVDFEMVMVALESLIGNCAAQIPVYNFATHSRLDVFENVEPAKYVIFEGLFALYSKRITQMSHLRFFVDCGVDIMIRRRIERDVKSRGRTVKQVVGQFLDTVLPMYYEFIEPTKKAADTIIDGEMAIGDVLALMNVGGSLNPAAK